MLTTANSLQCCTARKYQTYMVSNAIVGYVCLAFCADLLKTANTEWDDLLSPSRRMAVSRNGGPLTLQDLLPFGIAYCLLSNLMFAIACCPLLLLRVVAIAAA